MKNLFFILILFMSCKQPPSVRQSENETSSTSFEEKELKVGGETVLFKLWKGKDAVSDPQEYALMLSDDRLAEQNLKTILKNYGFSIFTEDFPENEFNIVQLVFFVPRNTIEQSRLNVQKIQGVLIYFSESGKLRSGVYSKKNDRLQLITDLNASPEAIDANAYWLGSQLFKKNESETMASIVLSSTVKIPKPRRLYNPFKDDLIAMLQKRLEE